MVFGFLVRIVTWELMVSWLPAILFLEMSGKNNSTESGITMHSASLFTYFDLTGYIYGVQSLLF